MHYIIMINNPEVGKNGLLGTFNSLTRAKKKFVDYKNHYQESLFLFDSGLNTLEKREAQA